jgi:antitoxin (DNA-binding transcriptional repressor) of toxin-antitoxin stability system
MLKANIHDFKTHLSRYLIKVKAGEVIQICDRNIPVATVTAISSKITEPRPVGLAKGLVTIKDSFFDPLPKDIIHAFNNPTPIK